MKIFQSLMVRGRILDASQPLMIFLESLLGLQGAHEEAAEKEGVLQQGRSEILLKTKVHPSGCIFQLCVPCVE